MFNPFQSLLKAAIGLTSLPIMVVTDVLTLPASAYEDSDPFERTRVTMSSVRSNLSNAVSSKEQD